MQNKRLLPHPHEGRKQTLKKISGELIGKKIFAGKNLCKGLPGVEGKIIDETLNTFTVQTIRGKKTIQKKGNVFTFPQLGIEINGSELLVRPQDRTKKMLQLSSKIR